MKTKIIILILMLCLIPLYHAFSADEVLEGEITGLGGYVGVEGGEGGEAKFTEYRDLREPGDFYLRGRFNFDTPDYFLRFDMRDPGYDTQYYNLEGGMYGKFKLDLFYDEIPHNITFDARTFFLGAGHDALVGTPNTNVGSWNTFDYSTERRKYGGGLKFDMFKPFFFDASYAREEKEGIKPAGVTDIDIPFEDLFEIPEPVNYITNELKLSAGYAQNPVFLALNYYYSQFNNSRSTLFIDPAALTAPDNFLSLPNDNDFYKISLKGAVKLPFKSRFSTNISYGKGNSETSFVPTFDGDIKRYNYDFALTSNPIRWFDTKIYYQYYKWDNKSNVDPTVVEPVFFSYRTGTGGIDLGFRLPHRFYLAAGYKYVDTKRWWLRGDQALPDNQDNILSTELKWSGLDFMDFKIGYEWMGRETDWPNLAAHFTPANPTRRFAYQEQDRDTFKAGIDIYPIDNLNVGLGYQYKKSNYQSDGVAGGVAGPGFFGLKNDKRDEFDFSTDYMIGKIAKVFGYFDYEFIKLNQNQFSVLIFEAPWSVKQTEKTYGYGIGADIYVIPKKLTFKFLHDYVKSNGLADYSLDQAAFGLTGLPINLGNWDDYTKYAFKFKAIYQLTKALSLSAGYGYERFKYEDAQLDNYQFVGTSVIIPTTFFLSGAYKDQSYSANLVFGSITYKF